MFHPKQTHREPLALNEKNDPLNEIACPSLMVRWKGEIQGFHFFCEKNAIHYTRK
jgi:hypothetical protein